MKHMPLATLFVALATAGISGVARADLIVVNDKPTQAAQVALPRPAMAMAMAVAPDSGTPAAAALPVSASATPATLLHAPSALFSSPPPAAPAASSAASPDLVVVQPQPTSLTQGRLVQVGAPMPGPALKGWAKDVPLSLALEQVLPPGWALETHGVDLDKGVSWRGGRSWHAVLGEMAYGHHFDARVDWVSQRVVLGPAGSLAPSVAGSPAPVRKEGAPAPAPAVAMAPLVAQVVPAAAPVAAPAPVVWALDPKRTLRENIEAWADKAGWNHVVWEGADYPVVAPATFTGAFDSPSGPVATVISAYADSEQPLLATLHRRDKVVHVKNRGYVPNTVVPSSPSEVAPRSFPNPGVGN